MPSVRCICSSLASVQCDRTSPHPAVVQVDQPARDAQQHDAAAIVPAQAALRPVSVFRHVAADGAAQVAARHILRPALSRFSIDSQE